MNTRRPTTYTADQIAAAYRFSSLYAAGNLGAGQTIALYELESFSPSDIATYQACYGTATSVSQVPVDGGPSGSSSGGGEAALDIESLIGLAPRANILVYSGPNAAVDTPGSGPYDTYAEIMSDNRAKVISTPWGLCEPQEGATNAAAENTLFEEAAVQGQSIVAASGDSGAQDCTDQNGKPIGGLAVWTIRRASRSSPASGGPRCLPSVRRRARRFGTTPRNLLDRPAPAAAASHRSGRCPSIRPARPPP